MRDYPALVERLRQWRLIPDRQRASAAKRFAPELAVREIHEAAEAIEELLDALRAQRVAWLRLSCRYCGEPRYRHPIDGSCEGDLPATVHYATRGEREDCDSGHPEEH